MRTLFFLLLFAATGFSNSFVPGTGARYQLTVGDMAAQVVLSVTHSNKKEMGVEFHFQGKAGQLPIQLWQRAHLAKTTPPRLTHAYLQSSFMTRPESFNVKDVSKKGLQFTDFIFGDKKALKKNRVGRSAVKVGKATVQADHYRLKKDGQTIDFWLSDSIKPFGLVKLESKGGTPFHLSLKARVKNVTPKIDPKKAVPLTPMTKTLLGKTGIPLLP